MEQISKIFSYYDKLIMSISPGYSGILSLAILSLFIWALYRFIKGNFIWFVIIIVFIPATWPALKSIGRALMIIGEFLLVRIFFKG